MSLYYVLIICIVVLYNCFVYLKQKISRTDIIEDECGKPMLGLTILSMIIRYLKNDLFKKLEQRGTSLRDQDILWVVTVPAIWSDAAKQFTKEATKEVYVVIIMKFNLIIC